MAVSDLPSPSFGGGGALISTAGLLGSAGAGCAPGLPAGVVAAGLPAGVVAPGLPAGSACHSSSCDSLSSPP